MGKKLSKIGSGSLLLLPCREVLKINFCDNSYVSWLTCSSELSVRMRLTMFLGFCPNVDLTELFNLALEQQDDRQSN